MKNKRLLLLISLLFLTIAIYSNVISGEFMFDDERFITKNALVINPSALIETDVVTALTTGIRPVTVLSFATNYMLTGLSEKGFHITNILIHLIAILLVFLLVRKTLNTSLSYEMSHHRIDLISFFITAIFALHPVQTEAVSYISQRAESLASVFYLLSLYMLIRYYEAENIAKSVTFYTSGFVCYIAGWAAKEIVLTMPLIFLLYIIFLSNMKKMKKALIGTAPFFILGLFIGIKLLSSFKKGAEAGFGVEGIGQPEYLYTQLNVLLTYLRMIFFPYGLNIDHDYPVYRNIFDPGVAGPLVFWMTVLSACFYALCIKNRWRYHLRLTAFGILWFIVILLPTSSLIPVKDVIFEHRIYLAMLGIVLSVTCIAEIFFRLAIEKYDKKILDTVIVAVAIVVVLVLSFATYTRNFVWQNRVALWSDAVSKSPYKSRTHYNLAGSYFLIKNYQDALRHYLIAEQLGHDNIMLYYNLSLTYGQLGYAAESKKYFLRYMAAARK